MSHTPRMPVAGDVERPHQRSVFFEAAPPPPRSTLFPYTTLFRSLGAEPGGWSLLRTDASALVPPPRLLTGRKVITDAGVGPFPFSSLLCVASSLNASCSSLAAAAVALPCLISSVSVVGLLVASSFRSGAVR